MPFPAILGVADAEKLLFTKYMSWKYEQEIRVWAALNESEGGLYFAPFGEMLRLVKVISGARCTLSEGEISEALGSLAARVRVIKARVRFKAFEIVKDERGFVSRASHSSVPTELGA